MLLSAIVVKTCNNYTAECWLLKICDDFLKTFCVPFFSVYQINHTRHFDLPNIFSLENILEFAAFHCGTCTAFSQFQFDLHGIPRRFFFAETFWSLTHFVCLTVVLKLAVTVCISLHFQTFWPKSLKVFSVVSKKFRPMTEKHQIPSLFVSSSRHIYLRLQWNGDGVTRSITG